MNRNTKGKCLQVKMEKDESATAKVLYYLGTIEAAAAAQIAEPVPATALPANAGNNSTDHDGNLCNGQYLTQLSGSLPCNCRTSLRSHY